MVRAEENKVPRLLRPPRGPQRAGHICPERRGDMSPGHTFQQPARRALPSLARQAARPARSACSALPTAPTLSSSFPCCASWSPAPGRLQRVQPKSEGPSRHSSAQGSCPGKPLCGVRLPLGSFCFQKHTSLCRLWGGLERTGRPRPCRTPPPPAQPDVLPVSISEIQAPWAWHLHPLPPTPERVPFPVTCPAGRSAQASPGSLFSASA